MIDAALAAATVHRLAQPGATAGAVLAELDVEAEARILAPPLRAASRRLGKQLLRAAARCWPAGELVTLADEFPRGAHQNVALGAVVSAVGGSPADAAALAVHHAVTMPAQSAVRLLGLDPFAVAALIAELEPLAATVVAAAADGCGLPLAELPAPSSPLVDIVAVHHDGRRAAVRRESATRPTPTPTPTSHPDPAHRPRQEPRPWVPTTDLTTTTATRHRERAAHRHRRAGRHGQDRTRRLLVPGARRPLDRRRHQRHLHHRGRRDPAAPGSARPGAHRRRADRLLPAHRDPRRHQREPRGDRGGSRPSWHPMSCWSSRAATTSPPASARRSSTCRSS